MAPPKKSRTQKRPSANAVSHSRPSDDESRLPGTSYNLPPEVQQITLNTFATAFSIIQDVSSLRQIIQEVKGHLFNRDFSSAFGKESYLQAYALRWSAARALGYSHILARVSREYLCDAFAIGPLSADLQPVDHPSLAAADTNAEPSPQRILCIGGGAGAEVVALAACHKYVFPHALIEVNAVDSAGWNDPIKHLKDALATSPRLSTHASEAAQAKAENRPLLEDLSRFSVSFLHQDVLTWQREDMSTILPNTILCTIMFTLNELFGASLPQTTSFLLTITDLMPSDSFLLAVDSPGSYSEIQIGKAKQADGEQTTVPNVKKYPMKWLLDHTLLDVAGKEGDAKWKKIESEDSLWFRIEQKEILKYPIDLENMRYQLHLYQRIPGPS